MTESSRVERCRICDGPDLDVVLDLGSTPLANAFVDPQHAEVAERHYPLEVVRCSRCGLVQLSLVVRPDILFGHYLYRTSASIPMVAHLDGLAESMTTQFAPPGSFVVEVGSNDGVLLGLLRDRGVTVLGVEPASNLRAVAKARGVETLTEFFGPDVAKRIAAERGRAKVVVGNNVLAHIADLRGVAMALEALLDDEGVFVAEVPYLADLLARVEYDTIYHEHLSYFALTPLRWLFEPVGLELFDAVRIPAHGGSVRLYASRKGKRTPSRRLLEGLAAEDSMGIGKSATYVDFATRVRASRDALRATVEELRVKGNRLGALGATAKSCTLLNYCGIGRESIEFVADSTPEKQGLLTPGTHIPVREEKALLDEQPDFALLLAWNYEDAILERHAAYLARGGRFIHPIPLAHFLPA